MINNVTLVGRLTRDPNIRTTQSGVTVGQFSLAVDRRLHQIVYKNVDMTRFLMSTCQICVKKIIL
ncbi:TPA: single-stranded DNA-binding protein [Staphylococcus delphini]|nr:single-stranded DNA-binding protein [Staphylococcus delphini]